MDRERSPAFDPDSGERRADRYRHGVSPRRAGLSRAEWRRMIDRYRAESAALVLVEAIARTAIRRSRVAPTPACAYLALAREAYGRWRRYTGATLANELLLVQRRWLDRGLDAELVCGIVLAVRETLDRLAERTDEQC